MRVRAGVNPTEREGSVLKAVENLFLNTEFKKTGGFLEGSGRDRNDLAAFKELLARQQIRDTARRFLSKRMDGNGVSFELNKQAAFMGKVNFVDFEVALGAIGVEIEDDDLEGLVDWLCS